ncbi:MAG TPA: arginine--tRNA ligase [Actinomycetota bacterium]|nr:arginine--tRNA ligase [Actinomycetota bacterium]
MVTDHLAELMTSALRAAASQGLLPEDDIPEPHFERPRKRAHGDWATNVALAASKGGNPRALATALVELIPPSDHVASVEVAGPGFLNFHLSSRWLHEAVRLAAAGDGRFGRSDVGRGTKVNVEYVSANPTGPITVVLGRHAAIGDTISNLLEATGHEVTREFYFNDAGRQLVLFGQSVSARYLQHFGVAAEVPEDGYQGTYVTDLAVEIAEEVGDSLVAADPARRDETIRTMAAERMISRAKESLALFGTTFDVWFSEATLHDRGEVTAAIDRLRAQDLIEERDGAVWFLSSKFGDDLDRVVLRSDGRPTYFAADLGYLVDKFARGFDHLIYLWGADHHGTIARLKAAADALGFGRDRVEIPLVQIVTLSSGGEAKKASKRAGVVVPLDDLVEEVGRDAARYIFLTRSMDAPLDFDVDLAKEQAPDNPVYYVQYAHARICSILRRAAAEGVAIDGTDIELDNLDHPSEDALMRRIASYEEELTEAAEFRAPQRVTRFVEQLASDFTAFYRDCRVMTDDAALTRSRLTLCVATKEVIKDGLGLLGVGAPERM